MAVLSVRPGIVVKIIVVVTDFTSASESALHHAVAIARHYHSKIHLVHPLHPLPHVPSAQATEVLVSRAEVDAEMRLQQEAEICEDVACSRWVMKGEPLEVVERLLSFEEADLVVVGTHGGKGFRKLAIGSAAEHFFRHVHCPVLAVGPSVTGWCPVWTPKRILLTTDLQSDEAIAARVAALLAREHDAQLAILHVAPPVHAPYPEDQELIARPYFQARLQELLAYKPEIDCPVDFWVEFADDPVAEILRITRERAIDLIVLSVHREEPWGFHFVHDAYRIVADAPCPVLIAQRRL